MIKILMFVVMNGGMANSTTPLLVGEYETMEACVLAADYAYAHQRSANRMVLDFACVEIARPK